MSKGKGKPSIRLLMTTGCVEYWFLLHFEKTRPPLLTVPQKEAVQRQLGSYLKDYKKGDKDALMPLFAHTQTACKNGAWTLEQLRQDDKLLDEKVLFIFKESYGYDKPFISEFRVKLLKQLAEKYKSDSQSLPTRTSTFQEQYLAEKLPSWYWQTKELEDFFDKLNPESVNHESIS